MKKTCISPEQESILKKAIDSGEFSLEKIQGTKSSSERMDLVRKYFDDEELIKKIVRDIESRMGSKRENIISSYMERNFSSVAEETRKGILNRFKRMQSLLGSKTEETFMEELVSQKFGAYLTRTEANKLEKLTAEALVLKEKIPANADGMTDESLSYGQKLVELENQEALLYMKKTKFNIKDYKKLKGQKGKELVASWSKYILTAVSEASGATRAFKATADVSGLLRQNWKIASGAFGEFTLNLLKGNPTKGNVKFKIWKNAFKNTLKAVSETAKFGDHRFYDAVRAEIHAHPNSYNGVYDAASNAYGLRSGVEEQFPSSAPSDYYDKYVSKKNNIFKISEVAFNAVVLKARFELANDTIKTLKAIEGVNIMDKKWANPAGEFVSAFTGRGGLGPLESGAELFNKILFAPKYAASQFSPYFQIAKGLTTEADNVAAKLAMNQNLQFLLGSAAMIMTAETLRAFVEDDGIDPTRVFDPRSNSFGKVKVPFTERSLDFTGGNRSVAGLMAGIFSSKFYDSRLGIWRKKSFFQTVDGKPYYDFISGKYAPGPAVIRDLMKGEQFGGAELKFSTSKTGEENLWTAANVVNNLLMPITIENVFVNEVYEKKDLSAAFLVALSEAVGMGATDIRFKPQNDAWSALLNTDKKAYWRAVDELWKKVQSQTKVLRDSQSFQDLPIEKQRKKIENIYLKELRVVIKQPKYRGVSKDKLKEIKEDNKKDIL